MAYEVFKKNIVEKIKGFFFVGLSGDLTKEYRENYEGKDCFEKSCQWFVDMKALNPNDLELIHSLTNLRNNIAHRFLETLVFDKFSNAEKEDVATMINLNYKIDIWWIRNVGMDIQPEVILNNTETENMVSTASNLLRYIYTQCFNEKEENNVQATKT